MRRWSFLYDLPVLLEDVTHHQRKHICFMCSVHVLYNGAPYHLSRTIKQYLNLTSDVQCIVRGIPVNSSAESTFVNRMQL